MLSYLTGLSVCLYCQWLRAFYIPGEIADGKRIVAGNCIHIIARHEAGSCILRVDAGGYAVYSGIIERPVKHAYAGREMQLVAGVKITLGVEAFDDGGIAFVEVLRRYFFLLAGKGFQGNIFRSDEQANALPQ